MFLNTDELFTHTVIEGVNPMNMFELRFKGGDEEDDDADDDDDNFDDDEESDNDDEF